MHFPTFSEPMEMAGSSHFRSGGWLGRGVICPRAGRS